MARLRIVWNYSSGSSTSNDLWNVPIDGRYEISASVYIQGAASSTGAAALNLFAGTDTGSTFYDLHLIGTGLAMPSTTAVATSVSGSIVLPLDKDDRVGIYVQSTDGMIVIAGTVPGNTDVPATFASVTRIA